MKKAILKSWILAAVWLVLGPQSLYAGNEGSGGGHVVDHELYDLYLQKTKIDVRDLEAFRVVVVPVLDKIGSLVVGFRERLEEALNGKDWFVEAGPLDCPLVGMVQVRAWPAACQDSYTIRFAERLLKEESILTQGRVILHELVRAVASKDGLGDDAIKYLTPVLLSAKNADELTSRLDRFGFGSYMKVSDHETISQEMSSLKDLVDQASDCSLSAEQRSVRVHAVVEAIDREIGKLSSMQNSSGLGGPLRRDLSTNIKVLMDKRTFLNANFVNCNYSGR